MKSINFDNLKGKSLFVCTPMYGNQCNGGYMHACMDLQRICIDHNIPFGFYIVYNESLVTRARNTCASKFLDSGFSHMMFIDADVAFRPEDVLQMLSYDDKDILCGPYTKKIIKWDHVMEALERGFINPKSASHQIESFSGDFVFTPLPKITDFHPEEPVEVLESGTGFMMIKREVFGNFAKKHPHLKYVSDHKDNKDLKDKKMVAFFDTVIDPKSKRYLSEDYMFCQYARKAGSKVWLCPWIRLQHIGNYVYKGDFLSTIALVAAGGEKK
jgi:hypothetical protein